MNTTSAIRRQFLDYFEKRHGHTFVPSSPVVPHDDPTLLFTNSGMNQFKDVFLGVAQPQHARIVNSQKCIRAGGKHNDLEDVGTDTYHHTFFEMLGNWSFGDYFKKEAIAWAWDLLTNVWGLEKDRLHATVFEGNVALNLEPDHESAQLWRSETDIAADHVHMGSMSDNFWEMGESGPCGPCSEIHIDLTPDVSGAHLINADDARVIELWNLVFIQYNRDSSGQLASLPAQHVDTGLGFERLCRVLGGFESNYDTDVFTPIFAAIRQVTHASDYGVSEPVDVAYRVIADHLRSLTFALTDGAMPGNDGRGYVLRRILRRAVRHGWQTLEVKEPFLFRIVPAVVEAMGQAFPELKSKAQHISDVVRDEEQAFARTLDRGMALFDQTAAAGTISGDDAFKLHDTYGFPLDLTQLMARERGLEVDDALFVRLMEDARLRSAGTGADRAIEASLVEIVQKQELVPTQFIGYERFEASVRSPCWICELADAVVDDGTPPAPSLAVVVGQSPFYAEAGGQVGDSGVIEDDRGCVVRVVRTVKVGSVYFHLGENEAGNGQQLAPEPGAEVELTLRVDGPRRQKIMANHTATHLMNRALRLHVNPMADQKGSLVDDEKTRFDFAHSAALTDAEIDQVESTVNDTIGADLPVYAAHAPQDQARQIDGLRAVFGERYPPVVRVVSIGVPVEDLLAEPANPAWRDYSVEFCGGTHLARTGDAEGFVIASEEAVAKGVRRITAWTGPLAHRAAAEAERLLGRLEALRKCDPRKLDEHLPAFTREVASTELPLLARGHVRRGIDQLQKTLKHQQKQAGQNVAKQVVEEARRVADEAETNLVIASFDSADQGALRTAMDVIRKRLPDAALLLGAVIEEKVCFVAAVPQSMIGKGLKAGDWVRHVAQVTGGGGGGRPDMAQAGGKDPARLPEALEAARAFAAGKIGDEPSRTAR